MESINAPTDAIFFQHCTRVLFDNLLKDKYPVQQCAYDDQHTYVLIFEEENAMRYVGGYVVATLNKHEGDD